MPNSIDSFTGNSPSSARDLVYVHLHRQFEAAVGKAAGVRRGHREIVEDHVARPFVDEGAILPRGHIID
jgi:hypothetical protein